MMLYMAVTNDRYEHVCQIESTMTDLAKTLGKEKSIVSKNMNKPRPCAKHLFVSVEVEEDDEA